MLAAGRQQAGSRQAGAARCCCRAAARRSLALTMRTGSVNWKHRSITTSSWAQQKGKGVSQRYLQWGEGGAETNRNR